MDGTTAQIRGYQRADLDALYRICLQTGRGGQDATAQFRDPMLLGHVWAGPYGELEPDLAFVVEDDEGVGGYILGALDARAFEDRLERDWWPGLRARYPEPAGEASTTTTRDEEVVYLIHHPLRTPDELAGRYPSHLHINLLPRLQSRGYGRRLTDTLIDALRARGSRGVHLFVNAGNDAAPNFYRRVGFTELPGDDGLVFGMPIRP
jgi:ribosomal protein S18 acetylase RimI-like enzyme